MIPGRTDPDPRYLRARGNRRVRKARLTRGLLRWSALLAAQLVIASVMLYVVVVALRGLVGSPEFALSRIEVVGARRTSIASIERLLAPHRERNLMDLDLQEIARRVASEPWVLDASAKRLLPDGLRLELTERRPVALARIGHSLHVVDATGWIVGPLGPGIDDDLPVLTGLDRLEGDALGAALETGVRSIALLRETSGSWIDGISELDLSRDDRITVRTIDLGARILLDPRQVSRNVPQYLELRAEIDRRVGPVEYVDLRWRDRIAVRPLTTNSNL